MDALIMTHAFDIGGQNIRWKQAADRNGDINALIVAHGQDMAGIGVRFKQAADRMNPHLRIRSVHVTDTYLKYPSDIKWSGNGAAVQRLYNEADVVHLNNSMYGWHRHDRGQKKPALLHHHGSMFRHDPRRHLDLARRHEVEQAVSTLDLTRYAPEVLTWLPTAYYGPDLEEIRSANFEGGNRPVRIAHAPTNREVKSTEVLLEAIDTLRAEGHEIEFDLIERTPWSECLARKAKADIYFDQVKLGFGCNAIEAWGMGIPVIAGAEEWTLGRMRQEFSNDLPFYLASEGTIVDAVRDLVTSRERREEWGSRGRAHFNRYHAEEEALPRLVDLYLRAIERRQGRKAAA
jgi:hypothetical protein